MNPITKLLNSMVTIILFFAISNNAFSKEGDNIFFVAQYGLSYGGDELVFLTYSDGTSETIDGGDGEQFSIGFFVKPFENRGFESQFTMGISEYKVKASNGTVTWSRYTVDLIQFYRFIDLRIGAGVTYHHNPVIKGTGIANSIDCSFDDSIGLILELDWFLGLWEAFEIIAGLKFTDIDYRINNQKFSGNSVLVSFGFYF